MNGLTLIWVSFLWFCFEGVEGAKTFSQYLTTGEVKDTKFGMNVCNEMFLNAAKSQLLPFQSY